MPNTYESLSLRDLLDAREAYHWHLASKKNVVATAVGLYLIRNSEPWPSSDAPSESAARKRQKSPAKGKRTLKDSSVRPYSWPCVLVFVSSWLDQEKFGGQKGDYDPSEMVPRTLYLPDGRMVPVCVVESQVGAAPLAQTKEWNWPDSIMGGGFPIEVDVQGETKVASAGCLVSDGHLTYALTSRHVSGEAGTAVHSRLRGERREIGRASGRQLTRIPLTSLYEGFSGSQTLVNLDVGLIEIANVHDWTSQIYGIGKLGPMLDLSTRTMSLRLIDRQVRAFGAASGAMQGKIKAFFYRYQSVAGIDHVCDFLIEPTGDAPVSTRPGDSGTVWLLQDEKPTAPPRPLAIQWGGHVFQGEGQSGRFAYALATGLSNVCSRLEVDLLTGWNSGFAPYWGAVGHYSIASFATLLTRDIRLTELMSENLDRISFGLDDLNKADIDIGLDTSSFVPLANVPDLVWKSKRGSAENPTHYADVDELSADGSTLLQKCLENSENVNLEYWRAHYTANGHTKVRERGLLPFRIAQFFEAMVKFSTKGEVAEFVCAAGILSHYAGDACQPLHSSFLNDGYRDRPITTKIWQGKDVHSAYETLMIERHAEELVLSVRALLETGPKAAPGIMTAHDAAVETVALMNRSMLLIPPAELCDSYIAAGGKKTVAVADKLWDIWGEKTIGTMADGSMFLARLWESAWQVGNGDQIKKSKIAPILFAKLESLYLDKSFVPSLALDDLELTG
jgi:hypothetical protein